MDRLVFGDNQFFGINHMSEQRAKEQQIRFQSDSAILDVLKNANNSDIPTFMCTTHDRMAGIVNHMLGAPETFPSPVFYPCMPYAHKYANAMAEDGIVNAIRRFLPSSGLFDAALKGSRAFATKDLDGLVRLLIDVEMKPFERAKTPVIFLQNVVVDFVMGLGLENLFGVFADHVQTKFGARPGFITMNLPQLIPALERTGVHGAVLCSNINKAGFRMSGGLEAYDEALRGPHGHDIMAMSVFASGAIPPGEAIEWLAQQPAIASIVFGASSSSHIRSTRDLVNKHFSARAPQFAS